MKISWLKDILLFLFLVLLQVWVFNRVHLFGLIVPLPYVYFILKLHSKTNRNAVVLWSFLLGLSIDILNNTPGLNALATTVVGFLRYYLLQLMIPREEESMVPSMKRMGAWEFVRYALIIILVHHAILFVTEAFSVYSPLLLSLKIAGSALLTFVLVFALEIFNFEPLEA